MFEAAATADLVRLASATYAINSGKWTNVFHDRRRVRREGGKFRFQGEPLRPGTRVLGAKGPRRGAATSAALTWCSR